ncbi:hypothetical protein DENSPDRAFT_179560 [Dentipellis sp. KUC8613]|nr:hypothetical protein DENSPDRAFT_179560 [Dentipellis sp. KUC8613]
MPLVSTMIPAYDLMIAQGSTSRPPDPRNFPSSMLMILPCYGVLAYAVDTASFSSVFSTAPGLPSTYILLHRYRRSPDDSRSTRHLADFATRSIPAHYQNSIGYPSVSRTPRSKRIYTKSPDRTESVLPAVLASTDVRGWTVCDSIAGISTFLPLVAYHRDTGALQTGLGFPGWETVPGVNIAVPI